MGPRSNKNKNLGPVSRRDFLRFSGGVIGAGLAYWTLRPKTTAVTDGILPPGALPAEEFAATCLRCGRCTAVCDQQAIEMGVDGRPFISGLNGWCDFSMDCVNVCPSGALLPVDLETVKIGTAVIDTGGEDGVMTIDLTRAENPDVTQAAPVEPPPSVMPEEPEETAEPTESDTPVANAENDEPLIEAEDEEEQTE